MRPTFQDLRNLALVVVVVLIAIVSYGLDLNQKGIAPQNRSKTDDPYRLDANHDGTACEAIP